MVSPDHCYVTIKVLAVCVKCRFYQFASYLLKMSFTGIEKAFCVLEFDKNNSWTCVQRKFWTGYSKHPPDRRTIQKWHAKFKEEGCLCFRKRTAPSPSTERLREFKTSSSGALASQSEELVLNFRCLQQPFGEW